MAYRRYNYLPTTQNLTGVTTGARLHGSTLFIGEQDQKVSALAAQIVATLTMTNATLKAQWQGSNDNSTFTDLAHSPENPVGIAFLTCIAGAGTSATIGVEAPASVFAYKYARCDLIWTSTTAGTTNDVATFGYNVRGED